MPDARLPALALLLGTASLLGCGPRPEKRPNVVLIIIDKLRADQLGAYGREGEPSPELDRYAAGGVRFSRVVAQCTWTRPSVASMLTSLHPRTLGIFEETRELLDDRFVTLAETLHRAGYRTLGATANPHLNSHFQFDQGFDHYLDSHVLFPLFPRHEGEYLLAERSVQRARELFEWVDALLPDRPDQPHYLQFDLMEVHQALDPRLDFSDYEARFPRDRYAQAVAAVSHDIGVFVESLIQRPGWANTVFVFTSDHGETFDDHPDLARPQFHGFLVYESQTLVPWILYSPSGGLPAGAVVEPTVRLLDLVPTILGIAGVPPPEALAGRSVFPHSDEEMSTIEGDRGFVVETRFRNANKIAVYTEDWTYVENRDGHPGTAPTELQRAGAPANGLRTDQSGRFPAVVRRMDAFLDRWERAHPDARPVLASEQLGPEQIRQLRSLGYLD